MFKIICKELTGEECEFEVEGETREETKERFYAHGAVSPSHREKYHSASGAEKEEFSKKIDEHLSLQG